MNSSRFFGGILCALIACMLTGCGKGTAPSESADEPQSNQATEGSGTQTAEKPTKYHYVIEVEAAKNLSGSMTIADDPDVGGGKFVHVPARDKNAEPTGRLEFTLDLPVQREAYFWFRTLWKSECNNSVFLQVPGRPRIEVGEDGNYKRWHWVRVPGTVLLEEGSQKIVIAEREDDVGIDQIVVTTNKRFVPVEIEE
jgi:hypothetical protein